MSNGLLPSPIEGERAHGASRPLVRGGNALALYKDEGVVLRTRNLGEADRIITLFTRKHGKVEGVARGSRRTRSRLLGGTQLFTLGSYLLYRGKSLDTISQAEIRRSFSGLREELVLMTYASYLAELLDLCVEPEEPSEELFQLIVDALSHLEGGTDPDLLLRWFDLRLMALLGYRPELDRCVACGGEPQEARFSVREGGLLCSQCAAREGSAVPLRRSTLEFLRRLLITGADRLSVVRPSPAELALMEQVTRPFVDYRLPRPLKTVAFLSSIKDLA